MADGLADHVLTTSFCVVKRRVSKRLFVSIGAFRENDCWKPPSNSRTSLKILEKKQKPDKFARNISTLRSFTKWARFPTRRLPSTVQTLQFGWQWASGTFKWSLTVEMTVCQIAEEILRNASSWRRGSHQSVRTKVYSRSSLPDWLISSLDMAKPWFGTTKGRRTNHKAPYSSISAGKGCTRHWGCLASSEECVNWTVSHCSLVGHKAF